MYAPVTGIVPKPDVEQIAKNRFGFDADKENKLLKPLLPLINGCKSKIVGKKRSYGHLAREG
jgi:hypothetical protein